MTTTMWIVVVALTWIGCGVVAYGLVFSYFQTEYADIASREALSEDRIMAATAFIFGLASLIVELMLRTKGYGLMYRSLRIKEGLIK